jgi:hypothetical protein
MGLSADQAFAIFGLTRSCRARELRRRYAELARLWHPDRHSRWPELLREATERMGEINAAYRIARQFLRKPTAEQGVSSPMRPSDTSEAKPPTHWSREPWGHMSSAFEREASIVRRLLVVVLLVWPIGEVVRRLVPASWQVWVSGRMVVGIVVGSVVVWNRPTKL